MVSCSTASQLCHGGESAAMTFCACVLEHFERTPPRRLWALRPRHMIYAATRTGHLYAPHFSLGHPGVLPHPDAVSARHRRGDFAHRRAHRIGPSCGARARIAEPIQAGAPAEAGRAAAPPSFGWVGHRPVVGGAGRAGRRITLLDGVSFVPPPERVLPSCERSDRAELDGRQSARLAVAATGIPAGGARCRTRPRRAWKSSRRGRRRSSWWRILTGYWTLAWSRPSSADDSSVLKVVFPFRSPPRRRRSAAQDIVCDGVRYPSPTFILATPPATSAKYAPNIPKAATAADPKRNAAPERRRNHLCFCGRTGSASFTLPHAGQGQIPRR